jgi:hypothetical protein
MRISVNELRRMIFEELSAVRGGRSMMDSLADSHLNHSPGDNHIAQWADYEVDEYDDTYEDYPTVTTDCGCGPQYDCGCGSKHGSAPAQMSLVAVLGLGDDKNSRTRRQFGRY